MSKNKYKKNNAKTTERSATGIDPQPVDQMALGRFNYLCMAGAGLMIVVGFLLMLGSSASVENYDPDIFSTRRIVVGPLIAFLGFVAMAIAIIVVPRKHKA